MSDYNDLKETLGSPGMKLIVRALRSAHKATYRKYRTIATERELAHLQAIQNVIQVFLPQEIEKLMNRHLVDEKGEPRQTPTKKSPWYKDWWWFESWVEKIRQVVKLKS